MCVSLSLAGLSSRVEFDLEAVKKPLEARNYLLNLFQGYSQSFIGF